MKKIFTLFGGFVIASTMTATAEEVSAYICDEEGNEIAYGFDADLTKDTDGIYTLANLFGVDEGYGIPFSFKFDQPEVGKSSLLEVTSNTTPVDGVDGLYYIKNSNDKHPIFWIYDLNGNQDYVRLRKSYIYLGSGGSYVYRYDTSDEANKYEYCAVFMISGTFNGYNEESENYDKELFTGDDEESPWLYVELYFNEPTAEEPQPDPILLQTLDVTAYPEGWYYPNYEDDETYTDITFKSFDAKLEIYDDGTYTLKNIFGSDYSISYTLGKYSPANKALVTFTGNIYAEQGYEKYPYFLTPDKDYMTVVAEDENGEKMEIDYLQGNEGSSFSYVYKSTADDIAEGYDEYYGYLFLSGYVGESASVDMWVSFGYNDTPTAVSGVEAANAPVEYYNLNGQRVADPSNGIFIRRQGSKTSKVMIK